MQKLKKIFLNLLKIAFSVGLIYWLIDSGKLDLSLVNKVLSSPIKIIGGVLIMILINVIITYRLKLIFKSRIEGSISFIEILRCHFIGLFFNTVLPGSVTGDFVKSFYFKRAFKGHPEQESLSTPYFIGVVLLDRVLGLIGLIILLGSVSLLNYQNLSSLSSQVKPLLQFNLLLFAGALFCTGMLYLYPTPITKLLSTIKSLGSISILQKIGGTLEKIWLELLALKKVIWKLIFISFLTQAMGICLFWWLTVDFSQGEFLLKHAFSFVPIGLITIAIPISPSGLGVGHAVFQTLFEWIRIQNGASLFNIFFLFHVFVNLLGVFPYLLGPKTQLKNEIE